MSKAFNKYISDIQNQKSNYAAHLMPELPLPAGISEEALFQFICNIRVEDAPEDEMNAYAREDFRRFVYTWGMTRGLNGKCLELGANPYFTTILLSEFTNLEITTANYFGNIQEGVYKQLVNYIDITTSQEKVKEIAYHHFNVETDRFPFEDNVFDLVIFGEIIEHLLNDPCAVLREIRRVTKPGGILILTTPNVARLENIARLLSGTNIYDPYSGYGPYGRHNREYNQHELDQLLRFEGFIPEHAFTADVHLNRANNYFDTEKFIEHLDFRLSDLGQYIFYKARKSQNKPAKKRPSWLYRSYPVGELL